MGKEGRTDALLVLGVGDLVLGHDHVLAHHLHRVDLA